MPPRRGYEKVLSAHRNKLARIAEQRGVNRVHAMYSRAQEEMTAKIRRLAPDRRGSFTAYHHKLVLGQIKQGQAVIAKKMAGELGDISRDAQIEALRGVSQDLTALESLYSGVDVVLPIDEASIFWGIIDERAPSLLAMHDVSMNRYGARLVGEMQDELALSLAEGETVDQAIDRILDVADLQWWQGERIVRTETSRAFNLSAADGYEEAAQELPDLQMRWCEHVADDGQPLDERVGVDSIAMHGQITDPGGVFVMPPMTPDGRLVSPSLIGQAWECPPNRPNDRSVISAWRPGWGIPAWRWEGDAVGGRRVEMEVPEEE